MIYGLNDRPPVREAIFAAIQHLLAIFVAIITVVNCAFYGVLLYTGWQKVLSQMASGKHTYSLNWPEWVFSIFLPIGAVLLIIHTIEYFIDVMTNKAACVQIEEGEEKNDD
ncbi:MAG: TRAP transporter small permease subunit [Clostridiales bacterium]|nr:TRAP transporter small permease subunit [Clostridiales bacterium]